MDPEKQKIIGTSLPTALNSAVSSVKQS